MAEIVIGCAGDAEFAKEVYDYLYSGLEDQQEFEDGQKMRIDKELISLAND